MEKLLLNSKISAAIFLLLCLFFTSGSFAQVTTVQDWSNIYHANSTSSQSFLYTVPTASNTNRVLAVAIASSQSAVGARTVTITYGGQTMTLAAGNMSTTTVRQHTAIYYLNEAGLDAASNSNLVFTVSGGTTRVTTVWAAVFDYVNQATPTTNTQNFNTGTSADDPFVFGTALTINASDQAVLVISSLRAGNNTPRTLSMPTSFTLADDQTSTSTADGIVNAIANRSVPVANTSSTCSTAISGNGGTLGSMTGVSFKGCSPAVANAGSALSTICQGGTSAALGGSISSPATGGTWSSSAGGTFTPNATTLNATWTPPAAYSGTATLTLTTSGGSCGVGTASKNIIVNPAPSSVTANTSAPSVCLGSGIGLTSNAASNSSLAATLLEEDFNAAPVGWTTGNTGTGGTPANANWTLRADGYNVNSETFHSNDNTQFYMSNSDAQGNGSTTSTTLQAPAFSTVGLSAANLTFYHYYRYWNGGESINVDISTNGTSWTLGVYTYSTNINLGTPGGFVAGNLNLSSYLGQANLYIRFRYTASYDYYWAIDNVSVTGTYTTPPAATFAWTSTPSGYTSSVQNPTGISPNISTAYTVVATNSYGCTASATTSAVTISDIPTIATISAPGTLCSGGSLNPTAPSVTANGSTVSSQGWQLETAVGSGTFATLTVPYSVAFADNGKKIRYTATNGCGATNGNQVTLAINNVPTIAAISAPSAICAGGSLNPTAPTVTANGSTVSSQGWQLETAVGSGTFAALTVPYSVAFADNGKKIRYTATNGCGATNGNQVTLTINAKSTAAVISGTAAICSGTPTNLSVAITGGTSPYTVVYTDGASNFNANSYISGSTISVSPLTTTTYTLISVTSANGCTGTGNTGSAIVSIDLTTSTNGGASWSNGTPTGAKSVVFDGSTATLGTDFTACSLRLKNSAVVTVSTGFDVTLNGRLTVESGSTFTLNSNANLLQNTTLANSGNIVVKRNSSALKRFDYTLWSSPVTGQKLYSFSPFTFGNRFYVYRPNTNVYNTADIGFNLTGLDANGVNGTDSNNVQFAQAKGYLIRMPWDHPTAPAVWNAAYSGVPNNGDITFTMTNGGSGQRFNLVGNPYPSPMSMAQFISDNSTKITGTLYFWRETNNNTSNNAYCSWAGGTFTTNSEAQVINPNGIIRTGQGFFVEASGASTTVDFKNGQRSSDNTNQFFKTTTAANDVVETNRFWLNLTNAAGAFSQMAAGYMTNATNSVDLYDGKNINTGIVLLNSILDNTDYTIQGKALPFNASDVIPLSYKVTTAGNYTITIDHVDGLFTGGAQAIYLKDNLTSTEHNLQTGAYNFASDAGTFNNRFEIVYQSQLSNPGFTINTVVIYSQNNDFVVNSGNTVMASIKVFDIRGRLLQEKTNINANQAIINGGLANEVLLVQITSEDGIVVTKKVIKK